MIDLVEYNIYDALNKKYSEQTTEEAQQACIKQFSSLFPGSAYVIPSVTSIEKEMDSQIQSQLQQKLDLLHEIVSKIAQKRATNEKKL